MNEEIKSNVNFISSLNAFDKEFYKSQFSENENSDINLVEHYLTIGYRENKNPSTWFDTGYYLQEYPDVKKAGINPFVHFLHRFLKEGRKPNEKITPALMSVLLDIARTSDLVRVLKEHHRLAYSSYEHPKIVNLPINEKAIRLVDDEEFSDEKRSLNLINPYFDEKWYGKLYGIPIEKSWSHFVNLGESLFLCPCKQLTHLMERFKLEFNGCWFTSFMRLHHRFDYVDYSLLNDSQKCYEIYISGLFDSSWYITNYKSSQGLTLSLRDFSLKEIFDDKNPNKYLNSQWYRQTYSLAEYQLPLIHYIRNWQLLTFNPSENFDLSSYLKKHPELYEKSVEPLAYFLSKEDVSKNKYDQNIEGKELKENLFSKSPLFIEDWYKSVNPDLASSGIPSINHYILHGELEGRRPNPYFDALWYKESYSLDDNESPLYHYLTEGYLDLNNPSPEFDSKFYLSENNLKDINISALEHYLLIGKKKGLKFKQLEKSDDLKTESIDSKSVASTEGSMVSKNKLSEYGFRYHIDSEVDGIINGWIYNESETNRPIVFEVYIDCEFTSKVIANINRNDLSVLNIDSLEHGFYINTQILSNAPIYNFSIYEKETKQPLIENQLVFPMVSKLDAFLELQTYLRKQSYDKFESHYAYYAINHLIPSVIQNIREGDLEISIPYLNKINLENNKNSISIIDVIVPVYKGVQETKNCIMSVIESNNNTKYRLIVINDKSPEPDMYRMLKEISQGFDIELFTNDQNLGFVKTVNIGMRYSDNDIILLNSDTQVSDGWLDSIYFEAYEATDSSSVGTVTPMSNNATICSFPRFCLDNELPVTFNLSILAEISRTNSLDAVDLPTAHGYCMFIKREVLNEVGYFDEQKWGKGYAEENDFSLRASNLGWRNVMTNKTFVQHLGSVSFAENTEEFVRVNLEKLNSIYPDYPSRVAKFVNRDPVRFLRNELAEKLLTKESKLLTQSESRSILFVSLTIGGGTQKATNDLSRLLKDEAQNTYMLTAEKGVIWTLSSMESNLQSKYHIENVDEYRRLLKVLEQLGVWHIHYHHVIEFSKKVWDIPSDLQCKYDITLHDYYVICPRVNMLTLNDKYCHEPSNNICNSICLPELGVHSSSYLTLKDFDNDINKWQDFYLKKMNKARMVFTPSKDTKKRILQKVPVENIVAKYHPEDIECISFNPVKCLNEKLIRIGFIGAIGPHKGLEVIKSIVDYINREKLSIEIVIFGYTSDDYFFNSYDFVKITGKYETAELNSLLLDNVVDVIFLTSIWPETYSYTFSEVLKLGLPIVSFNIGAVPERADGMNNVLILELNSSANSIISNILYFHQSIEGLKYIVGTEYESIVKDYYKID